MASSATSPPLEHLSLSDSDNNTSDRDIDRISQLSQSLLCHILSFLSLKEAAATNVLSKQWHQNDLWTLLPDLDLSQTDIAEDDGYQSFESFAFKILLMKFARGTFIRKFVLFCCLDFDGWSCLHGRNKVNLGTLLSLVVAHQVQEVLMVVNNESYDCDENPFKLNLSVFACNTLVVLDLQGTFRVSLGSAAQLPSVKVLNLFGVKFEDENSVRNISSGCPALEELRIRWLDERDNTSHYRFSSLSLRLLDLGIHFEAEPESKAIYVDTPSLEELYINYDPRVVLVLKTMHKLDRARLHINNSMADGVVRIDWGTVMNILQALCAVSHLKLAFNIAIEVPEYHIASSLNFPRFGNLVELEVNGSCCLWRLLLHMLQDCPRLQHLTFVEYDYFRYGVYGHDHRAYVNEESKCGEPQCWVPPNCVPDCLVSHLTTFKFKGFLATMIEMKLIQYVMKNSKVLRNVTIGYDPSSKLDQLFQELSSFERGSPACQLHFESGERFHI